MCLDELSLEFISNPLELKKNEFSLFICRKVVPKFSKVLIIFCDPMERV